MTNKRSAYTLFELVLVLALIVVAASLTFPLAQALFADTRLTAATDMVRTGLLEARNRAVEEGRPYVFAMQQNTASFQVGPINLASPNGSGMEAPFGSDAQGEEVSQGELPKDIIFCAADVGADVAVAPGEWQKIIFYPDGGAGDEDRQITFGKPGTQLMAVRLRGLTGTMSTAEIPASGNRP